MAKVSFDARRPGTPRRSPAAMNEEATLGRVGIETLDVLRQRIQFISHGLDTFEQQIQSLLNYRRESDPRVEDFIRANFPEYTKPL
jgi:hypothetical protein